MSTYQTDGITFLHASCDGDEWVSQLTRREMRDEFNSQQIFALEQGKTIIKAEGRNQVHYTDMMVATRKAIAA